MDHRADVQEFLVSRRARLTPEQAGLSEYGGTRRVKGLRREEVATLAGVSVDYYTRLERGNLTGASQSVLDGIVQALQLNAAEREYLVDLARAANGTLRPGYRRRGQHVSPAMQRVLDSMTSTPAFVRNGRMDVLAANRLGYALYSEAYRGPERPVNLARFAFLDRERSERFYPDWDLAATMAVAILRTEAGRDPYDRFLSNLIGELSTRSDEFRVRWAAHNVRHHYRGVKDFHHPVVGDLTLAYEAMDLSAEPGLSLLTYTSEPGSESEERLRLLASWAATLDRERQASGAVDAPGDPVMLRLRDTDRA